VAGKFAVPPDNSGKYFVYILYSLRDGGFYIGYTTNLIARVEQHSNNKVISTKFRTPFKLLHFEYFINRKDAKAREKFLKSGYGRKQLKDILKRTLSCLN
jgi:putative endonuclease